MEWCPCWGRPLERNSFLLQTPAKGFVSGARGQFLSGPCSPLGRSERARQAPRGAVLPAGPFLGQHWGRRSWLESLTSVRGPELASTGAQPRRSLGLLPPRPRVSCKLPLLGMLGGFLAMVHMDQKD